MTKPVSIDEQRRLGIVRQQYPANYTPALPERPTHLPPATTSHSTMIDVPNNVVEVVSIQTTERDRSVGYLLRTVPLSIAFAIVIVALAITLFEKPIFSWTGFVVFWLSFVGAWMYGEYRHGKSSPNAAALEEIKRKWDNIDRNDQRRWDAWEKVTGIITPASDKPSWIEDYRVIIITWAILSVLWVAIMGIVLLSGGSR